MRIEDLLARPTGAPMRTNVFLDTGAFMAYIFNEPYRISVIDECLGSTNPKRFHTNTLVIQELITHCNENSERHQQALNIGIPAFCNKPGQTDFPPTIKLFDVLVIHPEAKDCCAAMDLIKDHPRNKLSLTDALLAVQANATPDSVILTTDGRNFRPLSGYIIAHVLPSS